MFSSGPNDSRSSAHGAPKASLRRKISLFVLLFGVVFFASLALAEVILRVLPIPGITFHTFYYDDLTGQRYYPNTTLIYRNPRNDHVRRRVNSWGYLDEDHEIRKRPGVVRIGFFGDSFTEARQVPVDETFHRLIEKRLDAGNTDLRYECVAIAMSGYGTLHSYLEYLRWGDSLSLDWAVYGFCENDLGDLIPLVRRDDAMPFPVAAGDSFAVDFSFRTKYRHKTRLPHRTWQYLKSHTLLFSTLESRLKLLKRHGIKVTVTEADRQMTGGADRKGIPDPNSVPSAWPDSLSAHAKLLGERILTRWKELAESRGHRFAVIYIPRQSEMAKPPEEQDSWAGWLLDVCSENHIDLIDPSPELIGRRARGDEIFHDHLARSGHEALAEAFVKYYDAHKGGR